MSDIAKSSDGTGGRHFDVLRVLQDADAPLGIAQIADELGVHPNTVRFHLEALIGEGRVARAEPEHKGRGRPALMFEAIRQMDRGGTRRYRLLAEILTMGLAADQNPGAKALAAGRAWGRRTQPPPDGAERPDPEESIDRLVDLLDDIGFAPERHEADGETQVRMRHCPFLELAEARAEVICPIHLGLMQGALEALGAPVEVGRLDAFAEPDMCLAHLKRVPAGGHAPARGEVRTAQSPAGPAHVESATG